MKAFSCAALAAFFLTSPGLRAAPPDIVVCHYNVRNYVDARPPNPGERYGMKAKPKAEIEALIGIIKEINPDILGVCEMGSPERFEDFKQQLKEAGLHYSDSEYLQAADEERHLALLSRFPIVARHSRADVSFELNGSPQKVKRGFLDVTVQVTSAYQLRLVGVHLKSKLATPEGEALIRRHEAQELRRHLDQILTAAPQTNLLCYGDFNDAKNSPMFQEVSGVRGTPGFMDDLPARDQFGDRWTHYWPVADEYARIDYLFASPGLLREVVRDKSRVYRSDAWAKASDHRAVYTTITPLDR